MPHNCFAHGCKNYYKKGGGVQFFGFPLKNKDLLQSWISNVGRPDCSPTAASKLCSDHFKEGDYLVRPGTYIRRLKPDAVPTIFSDIPKHLKKKVTKRRSLKKTKLDKITEQKPMEISESIPCTSAIDPLSNNNKENCEDVLDKNEISGTDNEINDVPNKLNKEVETDSADSKLVSLKHLRKNIDNRRSLKKTKLDTFIDQNLIENNEATPSTSAIDPVSENIPTNNKENIGDVLDKKQIGGTDNEINDVPNNLNKKVETDSADSELVLAKNLQKKVVNRRSLKNTKLDKFTDQKVMENNEATPSTSVIDPVSENIPTKNKENLVLDKNQISGTDNEIHDVPNKLNKEVETDNADTKSVSPKHMQKKVNNRRSFKQAILYKFIHQKPMEIKETKLSTSVIIPISDNISTNNKESHGDVLDKYRISGTDNKVVNFPDKLDKKVQTDRKIVDKEVRLKIKTLQQKIRRQNNTIIRLKQLVKTLRGKSFLQQDMEQFLMDQLEDSSSVYIINVP